MFASLGLWTALADFVLVGITAQDSAVPQGLRADFTERASRNG